MKSVIRVRAFKKNIATYLDLRVRILRVQQSRAVQAA